MTQAEQEEKELMDKFCPMIKVPCMGGACAWFLPSDIRGHARCGVVSPHQVVLVSSSGK